jgi:glyoxalase family protein
MEKLITGIHHVTAIAGDAAKNVDFYAGVLGLRLLKKTVNYDNRDVYHFYYGTQTGAPGSVVTFFPYQGLTAGRHGKGMLNTTTFSLQSNSLHYWLSRLERFNVAYKPPRERFKSETVVYLEDPDGLGIELVFSDNDARPGHTGSIIPVEHAVKGFYNVEIWEEGYERTAGLLTQQLDHQLVAEEGNRFRFAASNVPGHYVDILCSPDSLKGLAGSGTVHHIAFSTPDQQSQLAVREKISRLALNVTPVLDRNYFTSIYFREPGGVLFEIATAGPGFLVDEDAATLGNDLKLPQQFEASRGAIETNLPPVKFNAQLFV